MPPFLEAILPFVQSPRLRERIAVALAFQAQKRHIGNARLAQLTPYRERQDAFHAAMRALNLRGDDALSAEERLAVLAELGIEAA